MWVIPTQKIVWASPPVVGDVYKTVSGPVLWTGIWFIHLQSNTQEAPAESFGTVQLFTQPVALAGGCELALAPTPSPWSQAGCSGPWVLPGDHKLISWCFVLFFSFPEKLFPFEKISTIVAPLHWDLSLPLGLKNHSWVFCNNTCQQLLTSPTSLAWIYPSSSYSSSVEFNWTNTFPPDAGFWSVIAVKSSINALMKLYEPEPILNLFRVSKGYERRLLRWSVWLHTHTCDWMVDICKITKQHPSSTDILCRLHVLPRLTNYRNGCVSSGTVLMFISTLVAFLMHFSGCGIHSFIP